MWPERTHVTSVPKLRSRHIVVVREDDSEEITENIEGNLGEDAKSSTSREEEISQEEETT